MKILKMSALAILVTISTTTFAKDGSSSSGSNMYVINQTGDNMALGLVDVDGRAFGGVVRGELRTGAEANVIRTRVTNGTNVYIENKTGDNFAFGSSKANVIDICNRDNCPE